MYNAERKVIILDMLNNSSMVYVNDLADILNASKETIRRDLKRMEEDGVLRRTHGGAVSLKQADSNVEDPFMIRAIQLHKEKELLCKKAAEIVVDGDTIFIDNSSTTLNILKYIEKSHHVTILTNSIRLLLESVQLANSNLTLIASGGIFRPSNYSLTGTLADDWVKNFRPNKVFFSCNGIRNNSGLTDGGIFETDVKRAMIKNSQSTYLLADHTKFGKEGPIFLVGLPDIDYIITDEMVDSETQQSLQTSSVTLLVVNKTDQ